MGKFSSSLKKYRCGCFALVALATSVSLFPAQAETPADAANANISDLKKDLLSDPLFLSRLRDQLSIEAMGDDRVRKVMKDYLLENPEFMLEVQQALAEKQAKERAPTPDAIAKTITENHDMLFKAKTDPILGNPDGDVTIIEFYDYNCSYCKQSYETIVELIKEDKNIRFVMKDLPILGEDSVQAHVVAKAFQKIMPNKYIEFHQKMMGLEGRATEASAMEVAVSLGADEKKVREQMKQEEVVKPLIANGEVSYKLGINFTPCFIIGTKLLAGDINIDKFKHAIAAQRNIQKTKK